MITEASFPFGNLLHRSHILFHIPFNGFLHYRCLAQPGYFTVFFQHPVDISCDLARKFSASFLTLGIFASPIRVCCVEIVDAFLERLEQDELAELHVDARTFARKTHAAHS